MHLPNYFLADLPTNASLTAPMIREACLTLKRNRQQYLAVHSTERLIHVLAGLGECWLRPDYSFRKLVLEQGPAATGFSAATLARGIDSFFRCLSAENLGALLEQDLGHARRLDEMVASDVEHKNRRSAVGTAPELLAQISADRAPDLIWRGMVLGLLLRSAQFIKCGRHASFLPRIFAHSIYEAEPKLGACMEIAFWRDGDGNLEEALFEEADCVAVAGTHELLAATRHRLPGHVRFLGHDRGISFAFIANRAMHGVDSKKVVAQAAADVVPWNQLGSLAPHVIYIEEGGVLSAEQFAEALAEELARLEQAEPRGELPAEVSAAIVSRRSLYEVRAAHSPETRHWCSHNSTAWTVVYEADPRFQLSCLQRFVYVKGVKNLTQALQSADSIRDRVSTVGLAAGEDKVKELATELARWGATRVCRLGQMQNPPLTWRQNGRPALADLIRWTDWEGL